MAYTLSSAQSGLGVQLLVNVSGSPPVGTLVGELIDMKPAGKNIFDDTTNLQSLAKEYLLTIFDPGKLVCKLNRVSNDAGQVIVQNSYTAKDRKQYLIKFPINTAAGQTTLGDTYSFAAYVEDMEPEVSGEKKVTTQFTLQRSGAVTFTQGS